MTNARWLVACYSIVTVAGSLESIRGKLVARPFGISTGKSVEWDIAIGFGAALGAPWPMVAASWWATGSRDRKATTRMLASMFLVGALGERDTYRALAGRLSPIAGVVAIANVSLPALLLAVSRSVR